MPLSTLRADPALAAPLRTLNFLLVFSLNIPLSGLDCGMLLRGRLQGRQLKPESFSLTLPRAAHVNRRAFQSDVLWYGWDNPRTELSSPALLEESLNVKRNNAHG